MKQPGEQSLAGLDAAQIAETVHLKEKYRGRQILEGILKGATSFEEITALPLKTRKEIDSSFSLYSSTIFEIDESDDSTVKLAIKLYDDLIIETVLLTDAKGRKTACLSSQVGCAMNCSFCRTGKMGFSRNLSSLEIVEQFLHLKNTYGEIANIVFMGMGEPLKNTDELIKAINFFTDSKCLSMSIRRITISTCGIVEGIRILGKKVPKIRLAVSIVTASEEIRCQIMPVTYKNSLPELKKALLEYAKTSSRRITLECALIKNINDSAEAANNIADWSKGLNIHVNVIPWNPVAGLDYKEPSERSINNFCMELEKRKIPFTRRYSKGRGLNAACGQLAVNLKE